MKARITSEVRNPTYNCENAIYYIVMTNLTYLVELKMGLGGVGESEMITVCSSPSLRLKHLKREKNYYLISVLYKLLCCYSNQLF